MVKGLLVEPQKEPKIVEIDETSSYQEIKKFFPLDTVIGRTPVMEGDNITNIYMITDDEFLFKEDLPFNRYIDGAPFYGNILILAEDFDDEDSPYISLTKEQIQYGMKLFEVTPTTPPTTEERIEFIRNSIQIFPF